MCRKIERYPMQAARQQWIVMPEEPQVHELRMEAGQPVLYCRVDPSKKLVRVEICGYLTGEMLPEIPGYPLGTAGQMPQIWHYFMPPAPWCGFDVV